MGNKSVVEIKNLTKSFGGKTILSGVCLNAQHDESVVIIGLSGSGKSVLLRHLIGLEKPDAGTVVVFGTEISRLQGAALFEFLRQARIGVVFQEPALFDAMSVSSNVQFPMSLDGDIRKDETRKIARRLLQDVAVAANPDAAPSILSGGMRKRVALARALALKPQLLLYDEPTSGLDPITSDRINALIKEVNDKLGIASITITHDYRSAAWIADRVVYLNKNTGKIEPIFTRQQRDDIRQQVYDGKEAYEVLAKDASILEERVIEITSSKLREAVEAKNAGEEGERERAGKASLTCSVSLDQFQLPASKRKERFSAQSVFSWGLRLLEAIGDALLLFGKPPLMGRFLKRLEEFFLASVPLIAASGILIGLALAVQLFIGLSRFGAADFIPEILGMSLVREIGPLLTGLLLAGRVGASICAEVGSMRVTKQLDALQSFGVDPKSFLLSPMFFASLIAVPCLALLMEFLGLFSAGLISVRALNVKSSLFISKTLKTIGLMDVFLCLIKATLFGIIIVVVAYNKGQAEKSSAEKIGQATTESVVLTSLLIIFSDYLITQGFVSLIE